MAEGVFSEQARVFFHRVCTQPIDAFGRPVRDCRIRQRRTRYDDANADRLQDYVFDGVKRALENVDQVGSPKKRRRTRE